MVMKPRQGRDRSRPATDPGRSARWAFFKAVLGCGAAGGLVGAAAGAAVVGDEYALPAAIIGGVPLGALGVGAVGWYVRRFGPSRQVRHRVRVGRVLGASTAGLLGAVAGLSVRALPWSLAGAVVGVMTHSLLTSPGRRRFGLVPGALAGALVGILALALRTGSAGVAAGATIGLIVGAVVGVFLIPALLAWIDGLPGPGRGRR